MPISIDVRGVGPLQAKLSKLKAMRIALRPAMARSLELVRDVAAKYPPQRPGSTYRRTGTLGRRWQTKVTDGLKGSAYNTTRYGPYVQDQRYQARFHRGRWPTDEQIARKMTKPVQQVYEEEVDRLTK